MQRKTEQLLAGERLFNLEHKWKQVRDTQQSPRRHRIVVVSVAVWWEWCAGAAHGLSANGSLPRWVAS